MPGSDSSRPNLDAIRTAARRIEPHVHRTPVLTCQAIDEVAGCEVFLKCENLQKVGAFKARGASNAVFSLTDAEAEPGVVTHSSGNHAQAHFHSCVMSPSSGGQFQARNPSVSQVGSVIAAPSIPITNLDSMAVIEQQLLLQAQSGNADVVQQLMQLEWLKARKKTRGGRFTLGSDDSEGSDAEFPQGDVGLTGLEKMRRRSQTKPSSITQTYTSSILQSLGVTDSRQIWWFSKKVRPLFGCMPGVRRCHQGD